MKRRTFLSTAGATLGMGLLGDPLRADASGTLPAPRRTPHTTLRTPKVVKVVVVGAGAFGGWTALRLAEMGVAVTLLDAYGPGSSRATSGDETRGLRFAYGDRELYTRWAIQAKSIWSDREREWGESLMIPTGRISLYGEIPASVRQQKALLDRLGVESEILSPEEVGRRWPQIGLEGIGGALWEPGATTLRANRACRIVASAVERAGGEVRIARVDPPTPGSGRALSGVQVQGGDRIEADAYIFACGSWLAKLFPEVMGPRISVPRRDVFLFGPPAGDARFSYPNLPNFSEGSQNVYGFPDVDGAGFKVAPFGGFDPFDPDVDERVPSAHWLRRGRDYLALRFPGMKDQPLIHSRVCQLENSPDSHFIIDRHPAFENVWIAGGGSGHGFKHGPMLGDYIARRILGEDPEPEATAAWALT
jgi:sarcosine oxidase